MTLTTTLKAAAVLGLGALGFAGAAAADQLADVKAAGKLELATDMHYAPFDMLTNGTYEGLTKDVFDVVAADLGVTPNYMDVPWTAELPGLEAGKFDLIIAPVTITPERIERYSFTQPIADATVGLVKLASDSATTKPDDLKGKAIGVQQGTAQEKQLTAWGEKIGGITVKGYGTADEAYADLAAGRLDAVAGSAPNLAYLVKNRGDMFAALQPNIGEPKYFAWVARKGDDSASLVAAIDATLSAMKADGRMKTITEKWLGTYADLPTTVPAQ